MAENNEINPSSFPLSELLSSPEIIGKLTSVISQLSSSGNFHIPPLDTDNKPTLNDTPTTSDHISDNTSDNISTSETNDISSILSKIPNIISLFSDNKQGSTILDSNQKALLNALRPYLSERRRELIDLFIKMDRFGSIFKTIAKE